MNKFTCLSSRVGLPISKAFGMEELLMKYSVDVAVWAHEHEYERTWPLYDYRKVIIKLYSDTLTLVEGHFYRLSRTKI